MLLFDHQRQCSKLSGMNSTNLLPTGCEERGVLGVGSISVTILPSDQDMKLLHYNWVVKIRNTSEAALHALVSIIA